MFFLWLNSERTFISSSLQTFLSAFLPQAGLHMANGTSWYEKTPKRPGLSKPVACVSFRRIKINCGIAQLFSIPKRQQCSSCGWEQLCFVLFKQTVRPKLLAERGKKHLKQVSACFNFSFLFFANLPICNPNPNPFSPLNVHPKKMHKQTTFQLKHGPQRLVVHNKKEKSTNKPLQSLLQTPFFAPRLRVSAWTVWTHIIYLLLNLKAKWSSVPQTGTNRDAASEDNKNHPFVPPKLAN